MNSKRKKLFADITLIFVVLLLGLSVFLIAKLTSREGEYVSVKVGDGEAVRYPLSVDGEYELNGGTNVLKISDGKAYMTHSNCPKNSCVYLNKNGISKTGEKIVCLPNRIYIHVVGSEEVLR